MELIIVTGLSGAGKTHALHCLEDMGFYCVDNLPPRLMNDFMRLSDENGNLEKLAFGMDIRGGQFFDDFEKSVEDLKNNGVEVKIVYFEASDSVLVRRFMETRRNHPLAKDGNIAAGIELERSILAEIRKQASFIIDTSNLKTATLNSEIRALLDPAVEKGSFNITVESFGYKKGVPLEADWVLDARFLPNPYYVPSLKKLTGNNVKVSSYVMKSKEAQDFVSRVCGMAMDLIPSYMREGKYGLTIAIGCTGGRHRSVATANALAAHFEELGEHVTLIHRDL